MTIYQDIEECMNIYPPQKFRSGPKIQAVIRVRINTTILNEIDEHSFFFQIDDEHLHYFVC